MWLIVALAVANFALSALGTWLLHMPGFDLTPIFMVILARSGENTLAGAIALTVAYMLPRPGRFAFVWLQVPVAILVGYLALAMPSLLLPVLVFYVISVAAGILSGTFSGRYMLHTLIGIALNFTVARVYGFFI